MSVRKASHPPNSDDWQRPFEAARTSWLVGDSGAANEAFYQLQLLATSYLNSIALSKLPPAIRYEAEDIIAGAFMALLEQIEEGAQIGNVKAWLRTIVNNNAIDRGRYYRRRNPEHVDAVDNFWDMHPNLQADDSFALVDDQETYPHAAHYILDKLPDLERRVLEARIMDELSVTETSRRLGLTVDVVKKGQRNGLILARRILAEGGINHDDIF